MIRRVRLTFVTKDRLRVLKVTWPLRITVPVEINAAWSSIDVEFVCDPCAPDELARCHARYPNRQFEIPTIAMCFVARLGEVGCHLIVEELSSLT